MEVYGYMGVDMRWIRPYSGITAGVRGMLPLKGELIVDPQDSKIIFKKEYPTQTMQLLDAKVEPQNVITFSSRSLEQLPFQYELKTLYSRENVRTKVFEVSQPSTILHIVE